MTHPKWVIRHLFLILIIVIPALLSFSFNKKPVNSKKAINPSETQEVETQVENPAENLQSEDDPVLASEDVNHPGRVSAKVIRVRDGDTIE